MESLRVPYTLSFGTYLYRVYHHPKIYSSYSGLLSCADYLLSQPLRNML